MTQPVKRGEDLIAEIDGAICDQPRLWWLGHAGFAIKYKRAILYVDPCLSGAAGPRLTDAPLSGGEVTHAGLVLCTHSHPDHLDPVAVPAILAASPRAKLVLPKSVADHVYSLGIPYHRMVTTDSGLRVEYLDDRIYSVPSAHGQLDWTPIGGYPYLGYLIRFGGITIYHAGDCVPYATLAERLRPYTVTVALLGISGRGRTFAVAEAAQLAEEIGAHWLVPMHYGMFEDRTADSNRFIEHMLFHRPEQRFKVFQPGEGWTVPED